ncbi:MAG: hypothetical protein U1E05_13650 [Patescibacteria group bacterium]|nr:hypothetical protein [Patescibacteria group bacterium]
MASGWAWQAAATKRHLEPPSISALSPSRQKHVAARYESGIKEHLQGTWHGEAAGPLPRTGGVG